MLLWLAAGSGTHTRWMLPAEADLRASQAHCTTHSACLDCHSAPQQRPGLPRARQRPAAGARQLPPAWRRLPTPARPLQLVLLCWMHRLSNARLVPALAPAASRRRAAAEYKTSARPLLRPRPLPGAPRLLVIAMAEPAAKKAKTENGIFKKHATCLVLDYGSQVGDHICLGMRGRAGRGGPPGCHRSQPDQRAWRPCRPWEGAMDCPLSDGNVAAPYACGRRERRRRRPPTAALVLGHSAVCSSLPAPLLRSPAAVHTTDCAACA